MEKYIVNYHTGIIKEVEVNDLNEAKKVATEGIAYTQEKITIENLDGEVLTTSYWYGLSPQEDEAVLETVGDGFYQIWSDELSE